MLLTYDGEALEAAADFLLEPVPDQLLAADGGYGYQAFPTFIPECLRDVLYKTIFATALIIISDQLELDSATERHLLEERVVGRHVDDR